MRTPELIEEEIFKDESSAWPKEARMLLAALQSRPVSIIQRRHMDRIPYRVTATIKLFSQPDNSCGWVLYTRDINAHGLGFLCPELMPLGHGGLVRLCDGRGIPRDIYCVVNRCRQAIPGWYEGVLSFNRRQWEFDPETLKDQAAGRVMRMLFS